MGSGRGHDGATGGGRGRGHDGAHWHEGDGPVGSPALLRAHGLRATAPRLRVLAALGSFEPADHPTADALHRAVGEGIALTTVYRTLETLEQAGLVWATHVPDLGRTYHLGSHPPHAHVVCRRCGRLADLPGVDAAVAVADPEGFTVEHVQVTAIGLCARCAALDV